MRRSLGNWLAASVAAVALLPLLFTPKVAQGQGQYKAPRTPDGKPNLSGLWQSLNEANWDIEAHGSAPPVNLKEGAMFATPPGPGVVEGGDLPYLPEALAKKKENYANRQKLDPENKCYMGGIPRANYMPYPFQIVQNPKIIQFAYSYAGAVRNVNMGKPTEAPADSWMGWANGKWEGETLVVDVTSLLDQAWFDRAGNFHSDQAHVIERFTMRSPDTMNYEATIEDSKTFSRPWKMSMPLYRRLDKGAQLFEHKCVEYSEELLYGHLRRGAQQDKNKK
jgi:hypothetical protein